VLQQSNLNMVETRLEKMHQAKYPGGVVVDPLPVTAGEEVTIFYNGLLGGAEEKQVYLHYGHGRDDSWENISDTRMEKTGYGWVSSFRLPVYEERFNFCFKDSEGKWDNNNGINWSFEIHGSKGY